MKQFILILLLFCTLFSILSNEIDIFNFYEIKKLKLEDHQEANNYIKVAETEYENGLYHNAVESYINSLKYNTNPDIYFKLGGILFDLKEYDRSAKAFALAGDFGYKRKDFAYYNATCASSLSKNEYMSLMYFEKALQNGYNYWNHINKDSDILFLRSLDKFKSLIQNYNPPAIINNIDNDLIIVGAKEIYHIETDITGNLIKDLIILFKFKRNGPMDSYYFALYTKEGSNWKFNNKTTSNRLSTPGNYRNNLTSFDEIKYEISKPLISVNLDNSGGNEVIVLSTSLSYHAGKVLIYKDEKLIELGEIEGFESIHKTNNNLHLIAHKVTDSALFDGNNSLYSSYTIENDKIKKNELLDYSISLILKDKINNYNNNPKDYILSDLFWFLYNHDREKLTIEWIDNKSDQLIDDKSNLENFMKEKIKY